MTRIPLRVSTLPDQEDETEGALARPIKCNNLAFGRKRLDGVFVKHRADRPRSLRRPSALKGRTNENLAQAPGHL